MGSKRIDEKYAIKYKIDVAYKSCCKTKKRISIIWLSNGTLKMKCLDSCQGRSICYSLSEQQTESKIEIRRIN